MKICVLGSHSFVGDGPKVGTQHIAQQFALLGCEVTYVPSQLSVPASLLASQRHRLRSALWPLQIQDGLVQVTPLTLLPSRALARAERYKLGPFLARVNRSVERTRHNTLEGETFDVCVFSAAASMTLVRRISAKRFVYRMNDLLARLPGVPRSLLDWEQDLLRGTLSGVWAVNENLAEHARRLGSTAPVSVMPNGVDVELFERAEPDPTLAPSREMNVIYVGALEYWVNVELIVATAALLPEHNFHIFGPWSVRRPRRMPANIMVHGPICHHEIAAKMKACTVGIIPAAVSNQGRLVEKPIKFYEYLAAGLGVAATSYAGARLLPFAAIGDSPHAFADAIRAARQIPARHCAAMAEAVRARDWATLARQMLFALQAKAPGEGRPDSALRSAEGLQPL